MTAADAALEMVAIKMIIVLILHFSLFSDLLAWAGDASPSCTPTRIIGPCFNGPSSQFIGLKLPVLNLSDANMPLGSFSFCKFDSFTTKHSNLRQLEIVGLKAEFSRWNEVDLRGARIKELHLTNFSFTNVDFSGAKIRESKFYSGDIRNSKFKGAYIADTIFKDSILPKNIKSDTILINVKFENCRFI